MTASDYLKACGKDVADAYAHMRHTPDSLLTRATYRAFVSELLAQWDSMRQAITVSPWTDDGQPYHDSAAMMFDVSEHHHLWVYTGGDVPTGHPMGEYIDGIGVVNHVFRAVHDYYGHAVNGYTFSPTGEECAFRAHRKMFGHAAQWALACETRAQSCAFNYGPNAHIVRANRPFPEQKAGILPAFAVFTE